MINFKNQIDSWGPVDGVILYTGFWLLPTAGFSGDRWGEYWPELVGLYEKEQVSYYWEKAAIERQGKLAIVRSILPNRRRQKLWQAYQKRVRDLRSQARAISLVTAKTPLPVVARLADRWYETLLDTWSLTNVFELANFAAPAWLAKKTSPKALEVLLAPEKLSFHQQSELELLRLFSAGSRRTLPQRLETYAQKWHWLANNYYQTKRLTARYFYNQVKNLSRAAAKEKIKTIENYGRRKHKQKRELAKKFKLPPAVTKAAEVLAFSIWWQDQRKALVLWSHPFLDKLTHWASRHWRINFRDLLYYTAEEWRDLFVRQTKVPARIISARKKLCVAHMHNSRVDFYTGERALRLKRSLRLAGSSPSKKQASRIISGTAVGRSFGTVRGIVRVLKSTRLIHRLRPGEILVAPMTSPDYVPAMRKAAAIITDVGGLMSHAAVVSRELGIPCVIGTKVATKVFKDGDKVEVDATKGIVRKI